ncbi:EUG1 [Nakaseomyces glabratus]|uniref:protein disulfide-isomerase n=1 Tax=Candida glabrata (strain ATCC 2001 / BCRC 20586 / JCM 3761 / NBRC 0622 / NRRL Y-65 / CBS 138) TaxID=284593 RepID=Q6FSC0_CANGA|nr:uncharacterized protein CAGL0H01727g [Nakaseomyces glabratus]KAH7601296.1 Thioredoxin [Nakaseomyces glabratus]KAH7605680.1 Thioredoxin [Nakaseomyces glabratus]QHS66510.1 EUG1 [Nakaseomyces glabratus]CAG59807.1 unnamed protein product [Nakaseomyces glabratus]|eukprot:XP_446874.1 uncharacterized protein CAGL0H01727g [[Candida] glabrata]
MVSVKSLALAIGVASAIQLPDAIAPDSSNIIKANISQFATHVKENPIVMVEFFTPWCTHSKMLQPRLSEAATIVKGVKIPILQVDCTQYGVLCDQQMIDFYPTLKVYKNHRLVGAENYKGSQAGNEIANYLLNLKNNPVTNITSAQEVEKMKSETDMPIVHNRGNLEIDEILRSVALDMSEKFAFIRDTVASENGTLEMYFPGTNRTAVYDGPQPPTEESISIWMHMENLPFFADIEAADFKNYMATKLPIAYFYYSTPQELNDFTGLFNELGEKYRGKLNFVGMNPHKFQEHLKLLNLKQRFPLFVIHNVNNNLKYTLDQFTDESDKVMKKLESEDIKKLVEDFVEGKAQPIIKSEPIPKTQDSVLYKLVAKTHNDFVYNNDKDVFVKYYAPWCQHSKAFRPVLEEIAELFGSNPETKEKIVFAEVDSTANDIIDFPVAGYPTLVLYRAGSKPGSQPIIFEGKRSLENVLDFIKSHSTSNLDGQALLEKQKQDEAKAIEDAQAAEAAEAVNAQAQAANADQKAFNNEIKDEL